METERLIFRPMVDTDKYDFHEIFSCAGVGAFIKPMTIDQVEKYFEKRKLKPLNPFSFAVVLKENSKMIGTIGLKTKDPKVGVLSYVFNDKYWNQGYCSESIKFILDHAKDWGFDKIIADCEITNEKSQHLLEKFNFNFIKKESDGFINHNTNEPTEFCFYSLEIV